MPEQLKPPVAKSIAVARELLVIVPTVDVFWKTDIVPVPLDVIISAFPSPSRSLIASP
jgi:hypothetical protein